MQQEHKGENINMPDNKRIDGFGYETSAAMMLFVRQCVLPDMVRILWGDEKAVCGSDSSSEEWYVAWR